MKNAVLGMNFQGNLGYGPDQVALTRRIAVEILRDADGGDAR